MMFGIFHLRRVRWLALALIAASCDGGPLIPLTVPGYFKLVSVNGQPLPYLSPPSSGFGAVSIWRGDLVLRPDGTFRWGIGGFPGFGWAVDGTYSVGGQELVFRTGTEPHNEFTAMRSGDSIEFEVSQELSDTLRLTYRRAHRTAPAMPGDTYRLTSINGRTGEPVVFHDTTIDDRHEVGTVLDSLFFSDGVFFRRHRIERFLVSGPDGVMLAGEENSIQWGAFERGEGWVHLSYYDAQGRDSLSIVGDTLIRRTPLITGLREERYTTP
jgi:hypothetical protein